MNHDIENACDEYDNESRLILIMAMMITVLLGQVKEVTTQKLHLSPS